MERKCIIRMGIDRIQILQDTWYALGPRNRNVLEIYVEKDESDSLILNLGEDPRRSQTYPCLESMKF